MLQFQSTLPVRGATFTTQVLFFKFIISIHAPRTGSDFVPVLQGYQQCYFNPRSPYGERLLQTKEIVSGGAISIHAPRTGSDVFSAALRANRTYFNPRSPYGERLGKYAVPKSTGSNFNPRSPYGERLMRPVEVESDDAFQSTLPVRGATRWRRSRNAVV